MQDAARETSLNSKRFVNILCATRWKVASSIPDGVLRIFHLLNPFDCTMALAFSQPLTKISTRGNSWRVKAAGVYN